jgi:hypothetical protein
VAPHVLETRAAGSPGTVIDDGRSPVKDDRLWSARARSGLPAASGIVGVAVASRPALPGLVIGADEPVFVVVAVGVDVGPDRPRAAVAVAS